ncbi:MAG: hypothetical protein Q8941_00055 [Bacteroidota bacterium]|nr:hypothetical protein [Bacteroidota bacterium]
MKDYHRLWILIGRKLSGEATEDELKELAILSQEHPDAPYYITVLSYWWEMTEQSGREKADRAFNDFFEQLEKKKPGLPPNNPSKTNNRINIFV